MGKKILWILTSLAAAIAVGVVAGLHNPAEKVNALWIVVAAACFYSVAYRFYGAFIAAKVIALETAMEREMNSSGATEAVDWFNNNLITLKELVNKLVEIELELSK